MVNHCNIKKNKFETILLCENFPVLLLCFLKNPTSFRFWSSKTLPKRWKGSCSQVLVAFFNKKMSDARREWSISNQEFYAMISPFWHLIRYSKGWETKRKKKEAMSYKKTTHSVSNNHSNLLYKNNYSNVFTYM